jgi:hypothetical protein
MLEAVCTSEMSVYSSETTQYYVPEDSNLHRCKELAIVKIHKVPEMYF